MSPPALPRPAKVPGVPVRGLPGQLGRAGDAAHVPCGPCLARKSEGPIGPPAPREEGSDVQAWTQAALPQEERRQPRQAPQRLRSAGERPISAQEVGRSSVPVRISVEIFSTLICVPSSSKETVVS